MSSSIAQINQTKVFYDRIALLHNLTFKVNGYRRSVEKYLRTANLPINTNSRILDAGCGTGMMTLAFYSAGYRPQETVAFDLSNESLDLAKKEFQNDKHLKNQQISFTQGNILALPFADESFDVVMTCGVLEYVSLEAGQKEMARVLRPNGYLIYIPLFPSPVSSLLEVIYNFKVHSPQKVARTTRKNFQILDRYKFPTTEPIGWTRNLFLAQKT